MKVYIGILVIILSSCVSKQSFDDKYSLIPTDSYCEFRIDYDTRIPLFNLYVIEEGGVEYLTFSNSENRTILIYNMSGELLKKVAFEAEGPNGIGMNLFGYYIKDFQHIYIPSTNRSVIYETDTTGIVKKVLDYSQLVDGSLTVPAYYTNHDDRQMFFVDNSLFIPQSLNRTLGMESWIESSPTAVLFDTINKKAEKFPMLHPHDKISSKEYNQFIADLSYSSILKDGKLIYSFTMEEELYVIDIKGEVIEKRHAKSRYIQDVAPRRLPNEFLSVVKKTCEMPSYGNIMYDEYRKVYYRFAYPETELETELNHKKILHNGKKEFSIIIMDESFNIIGETKFPPFTYVSHICFINEDGLFLCTSHFMREDYSDDWLRFQRIDLVQK